MPNANYLPVCSGMPTPAHSSDPVNLTSVSAVSAYLVGTPFAGQSIADLSGGFINYVYRVHLLSPFEGNQTVVLKHAQPSSKLRTDLECGPERQVSVILQGDVLVNHYTTHHLGVRGGGNDACQVIPCSRFSRDSPENLSF